MPWKPAYEGDFPSLGYEVIDWCFENLNSPDDPDGNPLVFTKEQEDFIIRWYAIDPRTGRFLYRRGLIGRPRGWGKSPFLSALALNEGLGPALFGGWDAEGQPVGVPWHTKRTPLIHVAAVSEAQTKNSWDPLLEMVAGPVVDNYPGLEAMGTFVNLPVGRIERITSSSTTVKGAKSVFCILDQTEEWKPNNGGPKLAQTMRTNATKVGGRTLESPNAYIPGEGSVAEESASYAKDIQAGKVRSASLLWDHREAPADTDLTDRESLVLGLRIAYGCSSGHPDGCLLHDPPCAPGWAPIEDNADAFWDPANDVQQLRSDFLNQITHASDSWISQPDWNSRSTFTVDGDNRRSLQPDDVITLGFDGSRKRQRGKADATALIAVRVSDGFVQPIRIWEQPDGPEGDSWRVPVQEVRTAVDQTFAKYRVIGFYADPAKWEGVVADWEAKYGPRLKVKASGRNPIEWWMTGGRQGIISKALEAFRNSVLGGELTHSGSVTLTQHVVNARRRKNNSGYGIYKSHPDSTNKIDAAVAAVLAWQARLDALSRGVASQKRKRAVIRRLKPGGVSSGNFG